MMFNIKGTKIASIHQFKFYILLNSYKLIKIKIMKIIAVLLVIEITIILGK